MAGEPQPSHRDPAAGSAGFPSPSASASDAELLQLARKLVALSPQQALAWAQSQHDPTLRQRLLVAVIQAWGESFPAAAMNWAMAQIGEARQPSVAAALTGALRTQPAVALTIAQNLLVDEPGFGEGCVGSLISRFSAARDFAMAWQLTTVAPDDFRASWMNAVFRSWAEDQPQDAMQALQSVPDTGLRETLFQSAVNGWAAGSPASLAAYAVTLPPGADRELAVKQAMDNWSLQDPAAMAAWLNTLPSGADFDRGVTLILARTDGANLSPATAVQWVESIGNPTLRYDSLAQVLREWSQTDPAAAVDYVKNAGWLADSQRSTLLQQLATVH